MRRAQEIRESLRPEEPAVEPEQPAPERRETPRTRRTAWLADAKKTLRDMPEGRERDRLERRVAFEERDRKRTIVDDLATETLIGVASGVEALVGVASMATGGRAGQALEEAGLHPQRVVQALRRTQSKETKAALEAFDSADGIQEAVEVVMENPRLLAGTMAQTVPLMVSGSLVGRGLMWAAPKLAKVMRPAFNAMRKATKARPVQRAAARGRALTRTGAPALSPRWAAAAGEGAVAGGLTAEAIRQDPGSEGRLTVGQSALAAGAGVATASVAGVVSRVARRFGGATDIEQWLVKTADEPAATKKQVATAIVTGAVAEGVEEALQGLAEGTAQNVATGKAVLDGAEQNLVLGTAAGLLFGGGMNAAVAARHSSPSEWRADFRESARKVIESAKKLGDAGQPGRSTTAANRDRGDGPLDREATGAITPEPAPASPSDLPEGPSEQRAEGKVEAAPSGAIGGEFWSRVQTDRTEALQDAGVSADDQVEWERFFALADEGYAQMEKWKVNPVAEAAAVAQELEGAVTAAPGADPGSGRSRGTGESGATATLSPQPSSVMRAGEAQRADQAVEPTPQDRPETAPRITSPGAAEAPSPAPQRGGLDPDVDLGEMVEAADTGAAGTGTQRVLDSLRDRNLPGVDAIRDAEAEPEPETLASEPAPKGRRRGTKPDVKTAIREAVAAAPKIGSGWVELAELRDRLGETYARGDIDKALIEMYRADEANLTLNEDQMMLTQADRDSALPFGNVSMHRVRIEGNVSQSIAESAPKPGAGFNVDRFHENLNAQKIRPTDPEAVKVAAILGQPVLPEVDNPIGVPKDVPSESVLPKIQRQLEEAGAEYRDVTVPIDSLIAFQETVAPARVRKLGENLDFSRPLGQVMPWGDDGKLLVMDGNHRLSAAKLGGAQQVTVSRLQGPEKQPDAVDQGETLASAPAPTKKKVRRPPKPPETPLPDQPAPTPAETPTGQTARGIEMPEMVALAQQLGAHLSVRPHKRFEGWFKPGKGEKGAPKIGLDPKLFQDPVAASRTLAHEIGHLVDWLPDRVLKRGNLLGRLQTLRRSMTQSAELPPALGGGTVTQREVQEELVKWSKGWREWPDDAPENYQKYRRRSDELYADALSGILNDPGRFQKEAPKFFDAFFSFLDRKPSAADAYLKLMDQLGGTREDLVDARRARTREWTEKADVKLATQAKVYADIRQKVQGTIAQRFFDDTVDVHGPVLRRLDRVVKEKGPDDPEAQDAGELRAMLGERNYVAGKLWGFAQEVYKPAKEIALENDIDWTTVGEFMLYDRQRAAGVKVEAGEDTAKASPHGLSPQDAEELIAGMKKDLGDQRFQALEDLVGKIRDGTAQTVEMARDAGLFTDELAEKLLAEREYATHQVYTHLDKKVSAGIHKRVGNLGAVRNTADATMQKMLVVRTAAYRNEIKRDIVNFLLKHEPESEYPSIVKGVAEKRGAKARIKPPDTLKAPQDYTLVEYFEDGEAQGVYVHDPHLADAIENRREGEIMEVLNQLTKVHQNFLVPLTITWNAAFQVVNSGFRDPGQTYRSLGILPGKKPWFAVSRAYFNGLRQAYVRSFGGRPAWASTRKRAEWEKAEKEVLEGFKAGLFNAGNFASYIQGISKEEGLLDDFQKQFNSMTPEQASEKANVLARGWSAVSEFVQNVSTFSEALGKAAGVELVTKAYGVPIQELPAEARDAIRTSFGSPDFMASGRHTKTLRAMFMFINPIIQSGRTNVRMAAGKQGNAAGWWSRLGRSTLAPKALMFAGATGSSWVALQLARMAGADDDQAEEIGENIERLYRDIPEYYKHNYLVFPVGRDEHKNVVFVTIPQDDVSRSIGSLLWGTLSAMPKSDREEFFSTALPRVLDTATDYAGDQIPSANSMLGIMNAWWDYARGMNPIDPLFNREILTQTENDARNWQTRWKLLKWAINQSGLSTIYRLPLARGPELPETTFQKARRMTPALGRVMGSFVRVAPPSGDQYREIDKQVSRGKARQRLDEGVFVTEATAAILQAPPKERPKLVITTARRIANDLYADRPSMERHERFMALRQRLTMNSKMGWNDPASASLVLAGSKESRVAILQEARRHLGEKQFREKWLPAARRAGVVTPTLYAALVAADSKAKK